MNKMFVKGFMGSFCFLTSSLTGLAVTLFAHSAISATSLGAKSIYGQDDRKDWYEVSDQNLLLWAKATAALVPLNSITGSGQSLNIFGDTYQEAMGLCSDQKFLKQPTPAFCSGFLVGPDLLLTAGHCITNEISCKSTKFVFDYALMSPNQDMSKVQNSQVFTCKNLVKREQTSTMDYALIRLDRPANRSWFQVRRSGNPDIGAPLTLIGHPAGLPSKISNGGNVRGITDKIIADVDAFGGNSGSAVVNRTTGVVEGILVEGAQDFERRGSCVIEHRCGADCGGERIFPVSKIANIIPQ